MSAAAQLARRVTYWQVLFAIGTSVLVGGLAPYFLLIRGSVAIHGSLAAALGVFGGGVAAAGSSYLVVRRHRYVLRALALGSEAVEPHEIEGLSVQPHRMALTWAFSALAGLCLLTLIKRPAALDVATGLTLSVLGMVILAAATLLLHLVLRAAVTATLELAPPDVMREVVEEAEERGAMAKRMPRRMLVSVLTPVGFLAVGAALIANAHLRRADERAREEAARALARATLELGPGVVAGAGLEEALASARKLGFSATVRSTGSSYRVSRGPAGVVTLTAPLDQGVAVVEFAGSTLSVLGFSAIVITLSAAAAAGGIGFWLGSRLNRDLRTATTGIRVLGTEAVLRRGTYVLAPARFQAVADLGSAIERLAGRFRVFAHAQERAIEARERAARMRGLFFASVSHDLKGPLNAILGFAALVRQTEAVTPGQAESLQLIERRGNELLTLIETILDAARVEARQLSLLYDPMSVDELMELAIVTGKSLSADAGSEVVAELAEALPVVNVDRVRLPRAIGTFIGHSLRTATRPVLRVLATLGDAEHYVRIGIEVAAQHTVGRDLRAMLDPSRARGSEQHRGLALALGVARSIVELHGGRVAVRQDVGQGTYVVIELPVGGVLAQVPDGR